MSFEIIIMAITAIILNVLDSATTALCFRQYPDKELKGEGNPIMRWLMLKNKALAEIFKHGIILAIVIYLVISPDINVLRFLIIMLGIVVLNNSYILISRAITKRKTTGPFKYLCRLLHVPGRFSYPLVFITIVGAALIINQFIWN